jgi:hypothetical protein
LRAGTCLSETPCAGRKFITALREATLPAMDLRLHKHASRVFISIMALPGGIGRDKVVTGLVGFSDNLPMQRVQGRGSPGRAEHGHANYSSQSPNGKQAYL